MNKKIALVVLILILAILGVYYLGRNNFYNSQADFEMRQKCQQSGEAYIKKNLSDYIPGPTFSGFLSLQNQTYAYNKKLNTCLISYQIWGSGVAGDNNSGWQTQYYIEDTLTQQEVAQFNDFSQMKPPRESWGYNTQDPKCSAMKNENLCFSKTEDYLNSANSLMNDN